MSIMLSQGISLHTSIMEPFTSDCSEFLTENASGSTVRKFIWKQFMLLPTPPLSPDRECTQSTDRYEIENEDITGDTNLNELLRESRPAEDIDNNLNELLRESRPAEDIDNNLNELLRESRPAEDIDNNLNELLRESGPAEDIDNNLNELLREIRPAEDIDNNLNELLRERRPAEVIDNNVKELLKVLDLDSEFMDEYPDLANKKWTLEREKWTKIYDEEYYCKLKSGLLHDCMWCGPLLSKQNNLKCGSFCEMENDSHTIVHPPTACGLIVNTSFNQPQKVMTDLQDVDPCVLPYTPLNDHSYHHQPATNGSESDNFGSETPSDSEAEIDVVTVPECHQPDSLKKPGRRKLDVQIKNGTLPKPLKLTLTLSNGKVVSRKSGGQKRTLEIESDSKFSASKKLKLNSNVSESKKTVVYGQSPCSSDSEDIEKRSQHNSMERKRRNDLKSLFQDLRVSMEELKDNAKASKVLILKTARRIIVEDVQVTKQYQNSTAKLLKKNETLKRRLLSLQRSKQ